MKNELLSVVMPAYNAEAYIVDALKSVLDRAYAPLEIIVVDDGSTDTTFARACSLDARITVLQQTHSGIFVALNRGIRAARGEWLAFHDADDLWTPDSLTSRLAAFNSDSPPDYVFGYVQNFYSPETDSAFRSRILCPPNSLEGIGYHTLLMRRPEFLNVGLFVESWQFGSFMEWLGRPELLRLKREVVPQTVLQRRLHPNNSGIRDAARRKDYANVLKTIIERKRASQEP